MTMTRTDKTVALLLALGAIAALGLALVAPARAAGYGNGFQVAKFKIEIDGWQKSTAHRTLESEEACGVNDHSFGREYVKFATTKPIYVTATHMKGEFNPQLFSSSGQVAIPTKATVRRSFTPQIVLNPGECEDNGGGAEATKPDCGTRTLKKWKVDLQFGREKKDGLLLSAYAGDDPFEACPQSGVATFPNLLVEGSGHKGKYIYADLSQDELFDPNYQQWISLANGKAKETSSSGWEETEVHWAVSFTRLGGKNGIKQAGGKK